MHNCENETMRDQLPLLVQGTLAAADAAALRAHVATCAACAAELELLTRAGRLFSAATPQVNLAAIVAKLPSPPAAGRPQLRVERGGMRRNAMPRYAMAAAASLVLVATLSFAALRGRVFDGGTGVDVAPDTAGEVAMGEAGTPPVALVGGSELDGLGEQQLETLLQELDRLEATVAADPVSLQRPVAGTPEGL